MYQLKNRVQLIGNLGNAPESRTTEGGKLMVRFSVATNESFKNALGEKVTETQWHNLVAWGKIGEIAQKFLQRGSEVAVEGKLINRNYVDKDGVKKYISEIQVRELLLLGGNKQSLSVIDTDDDNVLPFDKEESEEKVSEEKELESQES